MANTADLIECLRKGDVGFFEKVERDVLLNYRNESGGSALLQAAIQGQLSCCQVIHKRCPELLYHTNTDGSTALHSAVDVGHLQCAKFFIEADSDKKLLRMVTSPNGDTAMHLAVKKNHLDIVTLLLDVDPDYEYPSNSSGDTPLYIAWTDKLAEVRRLLIKSQPNQCRVAIGKNEWTICHHAASKGDVRTIEEIIPFGPDCWEVLDKDGQNCLHVAVRFEQAEVVDSILGVEDIADTILNKTDVHGNTPLHIATSTGNQNVWLALVNDPRVDKTIKNLSGKKAFEVESKKLSKTLIKCKYPEKCANEGNIEFFKGVSVDVLQLFKDENDDSVLGLAALVGHLDCCKTIYKRCPELLYQVNDANSTPLHNAALNGEDKVIEFLLTAEPKAKLEDVEDIETGTGDIIYDSKLLMMLDYEEKSALHISVEKDKLETTRLLIKADPSNKLLSMVDINKQTPLHIAVFKKELEIVKLLVERDPHVHYSSDKFGRTPLLLALEKSIPGSNDAVEIRKLLIEKQSDQCRTPTSTKKWTLLHHATDKGDINIMKEIMEFCPNCSELLDSDRRNFLHLAVARGHEDVVKYILGIASPNILNQQDVNGDTPLHLATSGEDVALALSLLYDPRVKKNVLNLLGKDAIDAITFDFDKRKAGVYGLKDRVDEKELKDRSEFDLLVGALICTVSFTSGIMVPGGYYSEGPNIGQAVHYKKTSFQLFIVANAIAFVLSLYAVFSNFCTKHLEDQKSVIHQLYVASFCSIGAIFAMTAAFISGSFLVLSVSFELSVTVCVIASVFIIATCYPMWKMIWQFRQRRLARKGLSYSRLA